MSVFTDIINKILGKIKGLVPGANTLSDVNLTVELDKLAKGRGLEWKTSVVDFLKLIGANSSRENRDALATELGVDPGFKSGSAEKNVTINEPFFQGHFPGHPIMPGVLQVEAIAQVAGVLMLRAGENAGKVAYFMSANNVKFRRPVRPGDQLIIEVEMGKSRGKIGKAKGVCKVGNDVVSEAEVMFSIVGD